MRWPHVVVRIPAAINGTVDERFANLGLKRRIGLHAAAWSGISSALNRTNMLGNFPAVCMLESAAGEELQVFEPPEPMPNLQFRVIWKAELDADPAIAWLRDIVLKAFDELYSEADRLITDTDIIMPRSLR